MEIIRERWRLSEKTEIHGGDQLSSIGWMTR